MFPVLRTSLAHIRKIIQRHWDVYDPSTAEVADPYLVAAVLRLQNGQSTEAVPDLR